MNFRAELARSAESSQFEEPLAEANARASVCPSSSSRFGILPSWPEIIFDISSHELVGFALPLS